MDPKPQLTGLKKRQQIMAANKMIFVWIVAASVVVSFCVVLGQFLVRQAVFNQKIISEKGATLKTLEVNLRNSQALATSVKNLSADPNLSQAKAAESDTNLKVVLDALPTKDDQAALAASLQHIVLQKSAVEVRSLTLTPGEEAGGDGGETSVAAGEPVPTTFSFTVGGSFDQMKTMLTDVERTIRPMSVKNIILQATDQGLQVEVKGDTYYLPAKSAALTKKMIKP